MKIESITAAPFMDEVTITLTVTPAAKWELAGSWSGNTWTKESWYYHDDTKKITKTGPAA